MVRVSFDVLEKVVVSSIKQFRDDRHVASAVAQPLLRRINESRRMWSATRYAEISKYRKLHTEQQV